MAKIAILDDSPEIVAMLAGAISPKDHEFMKMIEDTCYMIHSVIAFAPDLIVIPLHRNPASLNRPIQDYERDVFGVGVLESVSQAPELRDVPVILLGFYTTRSDMPEAIRKRVHFAEFLTFPIGLQELNPLITGLLGPMRGKWVNQSGR